MTVLRPRLLRAVLSACVALVTVVGIGAAGAASPEWNIARIGAPRSAAGVVIAVVDTGVDAGHPALVDRVLPQIDLVGDGRDGDPQGHGTHVAGTAAGADNGCGSIGVAPDAQILPVRVLNERGEGTVRDVAEGIRRAADAGAHIINLSLGSDVVIRNVAGSGLDDAIDYAWGKGSIPVLAAGNDGLLGSLFGSGYQDLSAVVVTATDNQDRSPAYATPIGSARWGISAPGGDASGEPGRDILSAYPGRRCALLAGTSMAAPHVSGSLAVLRRIGLSPQQSVDRLLATARDLGSESTYGAGLVDLAAAVQTSPASTTPPPTMPPATTSPPATAAPTTAASGDPEPTEATPSTTARPATTVADQDPPPTTSSTQPDDGSALSGAGSSSTTTSPPDGDLGADVVVTDEAGGRPGGVLVAVAAGALALSAAAGVALVRGRGVQP